MKKKLLFLIVIVSLFFSRMENSLAQPTLSFVRGIGSSTDDQGNSIAYDASGNVFVTGLFTGASVEFNPGGTSKTLTYSGSSGFSDFYIGKYNSLGVLAATTDVFKVGSSNVDIANKIYVDAAGNVYVVGSIIQTAIFDKSGVTSYQNGGSGKGFLVKYDNNLNVQWSVGLGPSALNGTEVKDIAVDASGNIYITGQLKSDVAVNFNPGPVGTGGAAGPYTAINLTPNGSVSPDMFVAVYNSGGVCQWALNVGGSDTDLGFGIDYDNSGNVYVTGVFRTQNVDFDPGSGTFNLSEYGGGSVTSGDIFVAKYSSSGTFVNAFNIGNALYEQTNGIAVDKSTGDFAITGYFSKDVNAIDFDPGTGTANAYAAGTSGTDMFVAQYSSSLAYQWHKVVGSPGNEKGSHLRLYSGVLYASGSFQGSGTEFGDSHPLTVVGGLDAFMAAYSFSSGTCLMAASIGGSADEEALGIAYDGSNIFLTGYNLGSGDYDPGSGTTTVNNNGGRDIFFAKYAYASCTLPTISAQPTSASKCAGSSVTFSVTASGSGTLTYQWKKGGSNASGSSTGSSYTISSVATGDAANYTVDVTNSCGTVTSSAATLTVTSPVTATASATSSVCSTSPVVTLTGSNPSPGTGAWTVSGGTATFGNASSASTTATITSGTSLSFTWTITSGPCVTSQSASTTVVSPVSAAASATSSVCSTSPVVTLTGSNPSPGTGAWTVSGGAATFGNASSASTTATITSGTSLSFTWTVTNGPCVTSQSASTTVTSPVTATASATSSVCSTSPIVTLTGSNPSPGTGTWTVSGGAATFGNASSASTTATITSGTSLSFTWTITNGPCTSSQSASTTVTSPVTATASATSSVCSTSPIVTLTGSNPSPGTGAWTVSGGAATFGNASSASTTATITSGTTLSFTWTITNGPCTSSQSASTTVTSPVTATASATSSVCSTSPVVTLTGSNPSPGTGAWTVSGGAATFGNASSASTTATITSGTTLSFTWTITNGPCTSSQSAATTVTSPVTATATATSSVCSTSPVVTLTGSNPSPGTGAWTVSGGAATFGNATSASTTATITSGTSLSFTWTITNGPCTSSQSAATTVTSPITATASATSSVCSTSPVVTLTGSNPSPGTGAWTVSGGAATFGNATNASTTATITSGTSLSFIWTITNGPCTSSQSAATTVTSPVTATASATSSVCSTSPVVTLTGSNPSPGTGAWTVSGGTATFGNATSASTTATITSGTSLSFTWTITNGPCTSSQSASTTVTSPVAATASATSAVCSSSPTVSLSGSPSTGTWSVSGGTATITSATNASTTATITSGTSLTFTWTTTNGPCTSSANASTTVNSAVTANAGSAQALCNVTTTSMAANAAAPGTGMWTLISGTGSIVSTSNPSTVVNGLTVGASSTFRWTITNGACSSTSDVVISVSAPGSANAGTDQSLCNVTTTTLGAAGSGTWSVTSGTGTVTNPNSATSTITGLTVGATTVLTWTVTAGACSGSDQVNITVDALPSGNAGADQVVCNTTTATLNATGTGTWSVVSGSGMVTSPSSSTSGVTGLTVGSSSVFQWTLVNGACSTNSTTTVSSYEPVAITSQPVSSTTLCPGSSYSLSVMATGSGTLTYQWKKGASNASGTSTASNYSIASVGSGDAANYTVEVSNTCGTVTSSIATLVVEGLSITMQPVSQTVCPGQSVTFAVAATGPSLTYQWKKNSADLLSETSSSLTLNNVTSADVADYTVLVSGCSSSVLSNIASLGLSVCTGTVDETAYSGLNLYPNPSSSVIHLQGFDQDHIESILLMDVSGQLVFQAKALNAGAFDLQVSTFQEGLYHLVVFTKAGNRWVEKVEVAK